MKKKAIIHIGGHKTGTTAIQKALFDNSLMLSKQDICYPLELTCREMSFFGQHSLAWHLLNRQSAGFGLAKDQIDQALEILEFLKSKHQNLVFSSESFIRLNDKAIACLKEMLSDFDIYVVIYVRRQDDAALALYQTRVVHYGETKSFEQWLEGGVHVLDYFSIIKRWSTITNGRIIVRPYDKNSDSVTDFEKILNDIFNQEFILIKPNNDLNKSVPASVTSIIRYYNEQPTKQMIVPSLIRLGNELSSLKISKNFDLISPLTRQSILKRFHEDNLRLSKEYLGFNDIWFDDVISENSTEWQKNNSFKGCDLLALVNESLDAINSLKSNNDLKV